MEHIKCLILGSISKEKGYSRVIEILKRNPKISLTVAGPLWNPVEQPTLDYLLEEGGKLKNLKVEARMLEEDEFEKYCKKSDIILFPYLTTSQSGIFYRTIGYLKPVLAWKLSFFEEIKEDYGACEVVDSVKELEKRIIEIAESDKVRNDLISGLKKLKEATNWDSIAKQHIRVYESL